MPLCYECGEPTDLLEPLYNPTPGKSDLKFAHIPPQSLREGIDHGMNMVAGREFTSKTEHDHFWATRPQDPVVIQGAMRDHAIQGMSDDDVMALDRGEIQPNFDGFKLDEHCEPHRKIDRWDGGYSGDTPELKEPKRYAPMTHLDAADEAKLRAEVKERISRSVG